MISLLKVKLTDYWYRPTVHPVLWCLLPFEWLFRLIIFLRVTGYRLGCFKRQVVPVPVIAIGNVTVGGTGKTPFVIWLAQFLKTQHYQPGIVSRGYGGPRATIPQLITPNTPISETSDEALLMARHAHCPVATGVNRIQAAHFLLSQTPCNIILLEDGLQHYALQHTCEIVLTDEERQYGNRHLLPVGPLREPLTRLKHIPFHIIKGMGDTATLRYVPDQLIAIQFKTAYTATQFPYKKIHAIAGIAHPQSFFALLRQLGLEIIPHVFPDHAIFRQEDIIFDDALPVVMTEKDSIKCEAFADSRHWFLTIRLEVSAALQQQLSEVFRTSLSS